jgi:hypothetical protein
MMNLWQFETGLRTLLVLDMQELVDAGAIADRDYAAWDAFHADPVKWFLEHPASADAVFRAIWRHRTPGSAIEAEAPPNNVVELSERRGSKR